MTPRVTRRSLRSFACAAVLATATLAAAADEKPATPPTPPPATLTEARAAMKVEGPTVQMPTFEVSTTRLREIDVTIKRLEKQIKRERKALEKSNLDETLNGEKVSRAAALFGGKSTVQRSSVSAVRIESMEKELQLLETLRTPLTKSDRELIEKLVEDQRTYRRELDIALR